MLRTHRKTRIISGTCARHYSGNSLQLHIYKAWIRYLLQYLIFFAFLYNWVNCSLLFVAQVPSTKAEGEGNQGMLYVGNVIVNRAVADCLDFKDVRTIEDVLFQIQGGNYSFEAVQKGNLFYQRARSSEKRLAK